MGWKDICVVLTHYCWCSDKIIEPNKCCIVAEFEMAKTKDISSHNFTALWLNVLCRTRESISLRDLDLQ